MTLCEFCGRTTSYISGNLPACCDLKQTDEEFRGHIRKYSLTWWKLPNKRPTIEEVEN